MWAVSKRRRGATYLFDGYDPYALLKGRLKEIPLYGGKTRQRPENRWRQHLHGGRGAAPQLWAPLVTGVRVVKEWERISDGWLSVRETLMIGWRQPRANIRLNRGNPHRIPPWEMRRLMTLIDRRGGAPRLIDQAKAEVGIRLTADGGAVEWYGTKIRTGGT